MICLPGSPFWNVFRRFGRDEMSALAVSIVATILVSFYTKSAILLALAGPVIEKIGFFFPHFYEAWKNYKTQSLPKQKPAIIYFKKALENGAVSLLEDVLVHDPVYVLLFLSLSFYSGIPVWLMTSFSFLVAVIIVAWLEVGFTELRYRYFRRQILKSGFGIDSYREARFLIQSTVDSQKVISKLQSGLGLKIVEKINYHDRYFENNLSNFSGRAPVVRLRNRTLSARVNKLTKDLTKMLSTGDMQTVQVIYTRPQEEVITKLDQFRFFPVRKDKFFWFIDEQKMPDTISKLPEDIQKLIKAGEQYKEIFFKRVILLDKTDTLYVAIDLPNDNRPYCVIELKIRKNPDLFLKAMRFVMTEFSVQHTTRSKSELQFFS